jgi:streptogramin lyase
MKKAIVWNLLACCLILPGARGQGPVPPNLFVTSQGTDSLNLYNGRTGAYMTSWTGSPLYAAVIGPNGNLFATFDNNGVLEFNGTTGAPVGTTPFIPAGSGGLVEAFALAFGPDGNLYVSNNTSAAGYVLKFDGTTGAFLETFTVLPVPGCIFGNGMTFGPNGDLYVSNLCGGTILEFNGATGSLVGTFVSQNSGGLSQPENLTFGPNGNLYVANNSGGDVLEYDGTTGAFVAQFTNFGGMSDSLQAPVGLQFGPDGNLYVVSYGGDGGTDQVLRFNGISGTFMGVFASANLKDAVGLAFTAGLGTNALLVGYPGGSSSVVLTSGGAWTATSNSPFLHISPGSASGTGSGIVAFTYDPFTSTGSRTGTLTIAGITVTVTQAGTNYLMAGTMVFNSQSIPKVEVSASFNPYGVAVDGLGNVYFSDIGNNAVEEWVPSMQQLTTLVSSGLNDPEGIAVDSSGNVYISDTGNNAIKEWSAATQQVTTLVSSGLNEPGGVAVDGWGNVYIVDTLNQAIKKWSPLTQQVTTVVSGGNYSGVAVDASGNVYFAFIGGGVGANDSVDEWSPLTQQVTTLAPSGVSYSAVAVDGSGNVYIANGIGLDEWSPVTQQAEPLGYGAERIGVAVDGSGNVYLANTNLFTSKPNAFVGPASLTEPETAGSDALLPVISLSPVALSGVYAPISTGSWLTIGTVAGGVVNFSFTANTSNSPRTATIILLGQQVTVTQNAGLTTLTPATLAFKQVVGEPSSAKTVTFKNGESTTITIDGISVSGAQAGDFALGGDCPVSPSGLGAGKSCKVTVTFTPSIIGVESATLSVASNSPSSPQTTALNGTGTTPVTLSASSLNLGSVAVGDTTASKNVVLTNHENVSLDFAGILTSGGFTVAGNTCGASITATSTCTIGLTFSPTAIGSATGTLTFTDSAENSPQVVSLTGTGTTPVTLSPSTLTFAAVAVGDTSAPKTVKLTNHGNVALDFSSILPTTNFGVSSNTCGASIAAGAACTVGVTFSPTAAGAVTGTLTFTDSAENSPQVVNLTGTGK